MWEAFANAIDIHIFSAKNVSMFAILNFNDQCFNHMLTIFVCLEQLGLDCLPIWVFKKQQDDVELFAIILVFNTYHAG